jgi:hypothetical protein
MFVREVPPAAWLSKQGRQGAGGGCSQARADHVALEVLKVPAAADAGRGLHMRQIQIGAAAWGPGYGRSVPGMLPGMPLLHSCLSQSIAAHACLSDADGMPWLDAPEWGDVSSYCAHW